ncbi:methyltransferase domain-containing protein [Vibrio tetraodonis]|uniref:methyltransferase domain-containing protein n=1 Tax=Vibrio tetraodonis TaxID=2231647 RepID=UPI000E0BA519|nr:methyltransferase domain-containing protein [Vibrio tetraodonis]
MNTVNLNTAHSSAQAQSSVDASSTKIETRSPTFIGDLLKQHVTNIGRNKDFMYAMTYHSDNEFGAIRQADKADLMTRLQKICSNHQGDIPNKKFIDCIHDWYLRIPNESRVSSGGDPNQHLSNKGMDIAKMIIAANPNLGSGKTSLRIVDIGGNDGKLTHFVAKHLGDLTGKPVEPYVLEVQTETSWDQNSRSVALPDAGKNEPVKTIYYNGTDINTGSVSGEKAKNPLTDGTSFDVAMYQHSLHHFPSSVAQQNSLKQVSDMLDKSGVVTISEHNSALSEHEIDLMHAVTELYSEMDNDPDISKEKLLDCYNTYMKEQTPSEYFSKEKLLDMATKAGFEAASVTKASVTPDHVYSITLNKGDKSLGHQSVVDSLTDRKTLMPSREKFETDSRAMALIRTLSSSNA